MQFRPSGSRTDIKVYTEQIASSKKISSTSSEERAVGTLDVLYIHDMQHDHGNSEKSASEAIKGSKANYGEINLSKLKGNSAEEKLKYLEETLRKLREEGKLTKNTDVIFACKPVADGKFEIESGNSRKAISVDRLIKTVRGVSTTRHASGLPVFEGTIHLFGYDEQDFLNEASRLNAGNTLLHANGKFNWDYKHENIVKKIIESNKNIRESRIDLNPEQKTMKMRDALQNHLGHPILRMAGRNIKMKYPRDEDGVWSKLHRDAIKRHESPVDMLISCVERGAAEKTEYRLRHGGLGEKIRKAIKDGSLDSYSKTRLLISIVSSKNDQKKKLDLLRECGIKFNSRELKHVKMLQSAVFKNRDSIEPEVIEFLENTLKLETVSKNSLAGFLYRKIAHGMTDGLGGILTAVRDRLKNIPRDQIFDLVEAALSSSSPLDMLEKLVDAGLRIQDLNDGEKEMVVALLNEIKDLSEESAIVDYFEKNNVKLDAITDDAYACHEIFSKNPEKQKKGERQLRQWINDALVNGGDSVRHIALVINNAWRKAYLNPPDFSALKVLLDAGWDPSQTIPYCTFNMFHIACSRERLNINFLEFLLKHAKKIDNIDFLAKQKGEEVSPLHLLAKNMINQEVALQAAELLIKAGADVNIVNSRGNAPIHVAAVIHNNKMLELLLKNHADVDKQNDMDETPLIAAVLSADETPSQSFNKKNFNVAVRTLLTNYANLDLADSLAMKAQDYIQIMSDYKNVNLEFLQQTLLGIAPR